MIIEYTNDGGEPQRFDAGRLRASEIQVIERTADGRWNDIKALLPDGDINAMRTVAWVIKKRLEPTLRFADFDPFEDELRVLLDAEEVRGYAEGIVAKYGANPEELAEAFDELRDVAADREACEQAIADATAPKDPAPTPAPEPQTEPAASPIAG
ncbi:hypothetical protein ACQEV4_01240 [Streptomyces shenzhenensis]|uniref:hypothetical protein n=1 Tax=Streptomyces shenzhenensis TaxID=943815 RepID=UPI003D8B65E0